VNTLLKCAYLAGNGKRYNFTCCTNRPVGSNSKVVVGKHFPPQKLDKQKKRGGKKKKKRKKKKMKKKGGREKRKSFNAAKSYFGGWGGGESLYTLPIFAMTLIN
jgi:hypothetical protein